MLSDVEPAGAVRIIISTAEELAEAGVVRFAGLSLDVFEILGEPKAEDLKHAVERFVGSSDSGEGAGIVEVVPVRAQVEHLSCAVLYEQLNNTETKNHGHTYP